MKDLGELHYFLGIEILRFHGGLFLSQSKYVMDLLSKTQMLHSKAIGTTLARQHDLHSESKPLMDATKYRSIVGAL